MQTIQHSHRLPQPGDDFEYYSSFPAFQTFSKKMGTRMLKWLVVLCVCVCMRVCMCGMYVCVYMCARVCVSVCVQSSSIELNALVCCSIPPSMGKLVRHEKVSGRWPSSNSSSLPDTDELFESLVDSNDVILERAVSLLSLFTPAWDCVYVHTDVSVLWAVEWIFNDNILLNN